MTVALSRVAAWRVLNEGVERLATAIDRGEVSKVQHARRAFTQREIDKWGARPISPHQVNDLVLEPKVADLYEELRDHLRGAR